MGAVTPATLYRESRGSLTLHIATFTSIDSSTWKSGLPNAIGYWANPTTPIHFTSFIYSNSLSAVIKLFSV